VFHAAAGDSFDIGLPLDTTISRPQPGITLVEVDGEVDTLTAPRLEADVAEAMNDVGAAVVVDLTGVTFLASSGLAVLIHAARRATESGGRLHVVAATRAVSRPITVTGADALFDTHADLHSALAAAAPRVVPPGVAPPAAGVGR
jgi:anti-sigma B factor antagonist